MQNQRRSPRKPIQTNFRRSRSRQRARKKKHKMAIWIVSSIVAILVIFAIIRTSSKFFSWVWLFVAGVIWLGIWLAIIQRKTAGEIVKIEIVDTVPRGRSSIVIFRETTASGLVRIVQHEVGGFGYHSELSLMNVLENAEIERRNKFNNAATCKTPNVNTKQNSKTNTTIKRVQYAQLEKHKKQNQIERSSLELQKEKRLANCIYDLVVIDFETTGLNSNFLQGRMDEILSVAIIDQDGNTLLSTLCSPSDRKTWKKAEEIHGITPAMVKGKPTFSEILPEVKEILYKAKKVIAYNIPFEMGFLWSYDAINDFPGGTKIREMVDWGEDPMLMYSAYIGNERWQKLTTAAKHFKYSFKGHDALEDVKATLHVYNALRKYVATYNDKEYILKYGKCYKKPGD